MTVPVVTDFFGSDSEIISADTLVVASAANPVLVIPFDGLSGVGFDTISGANLIDPQKWITAIIKSILVFSELQTDDFANVVVTSPLIGLETRETILKRRYSYSIDIYQNDNGTQSPDPDNI